MQLDTFILDISKKDWETIEDYKLKHPDIEGKWMKYRYAEKIPLNDIQTIMEPTPVLRGIVSRINAHIGEENGEQKSLEDGTSAHYFVTPQNPNEDLITLLEQEIAFDDKDGQKYVSIFELINWIEKKRSVDSNFVYSLKKPFVEYYKKRRKVKSYAELQNENLSLKERCECLTKEAEKFSNTPAIRKEKLVQKWATGIEKYAEESGIKINLPQVVALFYDFSGLEVDAQNTVRDAKNQVLNGVSPASIRAHIKKTGLFAACKQGERSNRNRKEYIKLFHKLFSSQEYQNIKTELDDIFVQISMNNKHKRKLIKPHK